MNWKWFWWGLLGVFIAWIGGIIPSLGVAVGLIGIITVLAAGSTLPSLARVPLVAALIVIIAVGYIVPTTKSWFRGSWPYTWKGLQNRQIMTDLQNHDRVNAPAAQMRDAIARYCDQGGETQVDSLRRLLAAKIDEAAGQAGLRKKTWGEWLGGFFGSSSRVVFPMPPRPADIKIGVIVKRAVPKKGGAAGETVEENYELSAADAIKLAADREAECKELYLANTSPTLPDRPDVTEGKGGVAGAMELFGKDASLTTARSFFSSKEGFWAIGLVLIGLLVIGAIFGRVKVSSAVIGIVAILVILIQLVEN